MDKKENKYKKLRNNTIWMTIGNFSSKFLSFLLVPLYTTCLTTADYGTSDLITVTISLLTPILTLCSAEGILRFTLSKKYDKSQIFTFSIIVFLLGTILLVFVTPVLLNTLNLQKYSIYFILYFIISSISIIMQQFVKGLDHVKNYVISGIIGTIVIISSNIILLLLLRLGIDGYLVSMILGNLSIIIFLIFKERLYLYICNPKTINNFLIHDILSYSIPLIPNSISWWINNSLDRYIISFYSGISVLGIYSVAYKIPSIVAIISTIFSNSWQISAIENYDSQDAIEFYEDVYKKYSSLYIVFAASVIVFIKIIARIMFAKDFYSAWICSMILILAAVFQAMSGYLGAIYGAAMKTKSIFITTMIGAFINIFLNLILIPLVGVEGAAIATLISYIVVWTIRIFSIKKIMPLNFTIKRDLISYFLICLIIVNNFIGYKYNFIINIFILFFICILNKITIDIILDFILQRVKNKFDF